MLAPKLAELLAHPEAKKFNGETDAAAPTHHYGPEQCVPQLSSSAATLLQELSQIDTKDTGAIVTKLRKRAVAAELVAAVISQAQLRQRGRAKFSNADQMLFTGPGLEQSTRDSVAQLHAARFAEAGIELVADLGCGIGADALGFAAAGIRVIAVDRDENAACCAAFNLNAFHTSRQQTTKPSEPPLWQSWCTDAETAWQHINAAGAQTQPHEAPETAATPGGLWFDPARRESKDHGKRLSPNDWSPSLDWVFERARDLPSGIKLGPALEHELIPSDFEAQWLSVNGSTIELMLWSGALASDGIKRRATVIRNGERFDMVAAGAAADAASGPLGKYLHEPDGAVIRAQLIGQLAADLDGWMLDEKIAYISSDTPSQSPFVQSFEIIEQLPLQIKKLRRALSDSQIGTLEIKKRGVDIDPADFRRQLRLKGPNSATLILTRVADERIALLATRLGKQHG